MKLLEEMIYVEFLMIIMAIWVVPMSYGHGAMIGNAVEAPDVAEAPGINDPSKALDTNWYDARATFYGDIHGGDTQRKIK